MRKLRTPLVSTSKGKKLVDVSKSFVPKPKEKKDVKPKIARVVVIKTINPNDPNNLTQIERTEIEVSHLPENKEFFELIVVMSPTGKQPPQYPPFQKSYRLKVGTKGKLILEGSPLSFSGGLEPPTGDDEYHLNLVQDVDTGEVWDIEDAKVIISNGGPATDTADFTVVPGEDDPKPKIARVVVIKTINDDITASQYHVVDMEVQNLPPSLVPYSLRVVLTANSTLVPDQKAPRVANFTLISGTTNKISGTLTFKGSPELVVMNNAYTVNSVTNQSTLKTWDILDSSVNVSAD